MILAGASWDELRRHYFQRESRQRQIHIGTLFVIAVVLRSGLSTGISDSPVEIGLFANVEIAEQRLISTWVSPSLLLCLSLALMEQAGRTASAATRTRSLRKQISLTAWHFREEYCLAEHFLAEHRKYPFLRWVVRDA